MNIYEKIKMVMSEVEYLSKDDSIEFKATRYKAISEEKVTSAVRKSLIKHGLVIFPVKQHHSREGIITTVDVTYRIVNTDKPEEYIEVVSSGTGADTQDKGVGKAMTYAYKYMLLRTFAIVTGEDPDKIASDEITEKLEEEKKKKSEEEKKQKIAKQTISEEKAKALVQRCAKDNVSIQKLCEVHKVKSVYELSENQHSNIHTHWDQVKEKCSLLES